MQFSPRNKIIAVLSACLVVLVFMCYNSIAAPTGFDAERRVREHAVIEHLVAIRNAEVRWSRLHGGRYTDSFDSLRTMVGEGSDSIEYIPYGEGRKFVLRRALLSGKDGDGIHVFECSAPIETYMVGMRRRDIDGARQKATDRNLYPGLKVGNINVPNNNAGNWE